MTCPASKRCPLLMLSDRPPYESSPHAAPAYAPGELLHVFLAPFSPMVFRRTFGVSSRGRGRPVTMHGAQANRGMRPDWSAFTCPRFSRKPRTLTSPTRLGCAFGPPRILRSHASDESLEVTWNGRTTPLARRDDRAGRDIGCSHSLPAQNHLRLHNQQWVTPTTNRRFGRIKKRLRRCAGEDPTRTA